MRRYVRLLKERGRTQTPELHYSVGFYDPCDGRKMSRHSIYTVTRALLSSLPQFNYSHFNQVFHHAVRDHPVFPLIRDLPIAIHSDKLNQEAQYFSDFVKKFYDMAHVKI